MPASIRWWLELYEGANTNTPPILLPDEPISAADLVGRAYRIARLNWRELARVFVVPSFFYLIAFTADSWLLERDSCTLALAIGVVMFSFVLMVISRWQIATISFAIFSHLAGREPDFDSAMKTARKKAFFVLLLCSPTLLMDLFFMAAVAFSTLMLLEGTRSGAHLMQTVWGLVVCLILFLSTVPMSCFSILNGMFMATLVAEDLPLFACFVRCLQFFANEGLFVAQYALLFSSVEFAFSITTGPLAWLHCFDGVFGHTFKDAVSAFITLLNCVLMTPLYALLFAAAAVGAALLHQQLRMRVDGYDLIERLSLSRST